MFGEKTGSVSSDIITVVGGKWTKRVPDGTPGSTSRTNKNGETVTEIQTAAIGGWITGCELHEAEFGQSINLFLTDPEAGENMTVSLSLDSRYLFTLCKCLPNIDFSEKLVMGIGVDKERKSKSGGPIHFMWLKQGSVVRSFYTKDSPNGLPPAVKGPRGWNFQAQEDFLLEKLLETFKDFTPCVPEQSPSDFYSDEDAPADPTDEYEEEVPL